MSFEGQVGCKGGEWPGIWLQEQLTSRSALLLIGMVGAAGPKVLTLRLGQAYTLGIALQTIGCLASDGEVAKHKTKITRLKATPWRQTIGYGTLLLPFAGYLIGELSSNLAPALTALFYGWGTLQPYEPLCHLWLGPDEGPKPPSEPYPYDLLAPQIHFPWPVNAFPLPSAPPVD
ncbi:MAG: hypothetical protein AB7F31_01665 [Parachlamydiales bacterium]